jgi:hypothetical protein
MFVRSWSAMVSWFCFRPSSKRWCDVPRLKYSMLDYAKRKTNYILLHLAYEQMVIGVRQIQRKNWVTQPRR